MALLLAGLPGRTALAAGNGQRPLDAINTLDRPVDFAFTADWASTIQTNRAAWTKELASLTNDPAVRERLMSARNIRLLEAMLERLKPTPAQRLAAYGEITTQAWALGFAEKSLRYANKIVDENPGDVDIAVVQFAAILRQLHADSPWDHVGGPEYLDSVARRVLALNRAGLVPDEHPIMAQAYHALFKLGVNGGKPLQARLALDRIAANPSRDSELGAKQAEFAAGTGDVAAARRLYEEAGRAWEGERLPHPVIPIPDFPRGFDVETRLSRFQDMGPAAQPAESLAILQADPQGKSVVTWEDSRWTSVWSLMDRFLAGQKPEVLTAVREIGLDKAQAALAKARAGADDGALLATYRSYAWCTPGQEALADFGEISLQKGRPGMALRSFREVLGHATDVGVRRRAQVGLWLSLAQDATRAAEFQDSFQGLAPDALYPWMGKQVTAQTIRQRLTDSIAKLANTTATPSLAGVRPTTVHTPPLSPWSSELFLTMHAEFKRAMNVRMWATAATRYGLVVGGPNALVGFGPDGSRPRWVRTAELPAPGQRNPGISTAIPASAALSVGDGRIYCAWGMHPPQIVPENVAAFEEDTGRMLWSTAGDAAWVGIAPVGSPVFAEGRVYVMAAQSGFQQIMHLVCLDARTGGTLWRKHIVSQRSGLPVADNWPAPNECSVAYHGCNLTVRDGAVYLQTNLGMLARCDARDGAIEWISQYPRSCARMSLVAPRQGSAPLVVGEKIIVAPRDAMGLLAVDLANGKILWQNSFAPSQEIIGLANGKVLVSGQRGIAAIDPDGGKVLWNRPVPGLLGKSVLVGARLYVSASKLLCLSADDGTVVEEIAQPSEGPLQGLIVQGDRIYGLGIPQASPAITPVTLNAAAPAVAPPPNLPMSATWSMRRQFPQILVPPAAAAIDGRVYVSSQGLLECVQADPRGTIVWQAVLPLDLTRILFAARTVLLVGQSQVTALEALTGEFRWNTSVPMAFDRVEICGGLLVLVDLGPWEPNSWGGTTGGIAAVDIASGKLLWCRSAAAGSHNLLSITSDGKDLLLTGAMEIEGKGTFSITCRASDGVFTAIRQITPAQLTTRGNALYIGVHEGMIYYHIPSNLSPTYRAPLDGSKPVDSLPGDFIGMNADWQRPELVASGDWLMIRGHQVHVYNKKDPGQYLDRPVVRAGSIVGNRLYEFTPDGLTAIDLVTKKQLFRSPASAGTQYSQAHGCPAIRNFDAGVMVTNRVSGQWDNTLQRNLHFVMLELLDPATGAVRSRQTLPQKITWVPMLDNDREADAQSAWINGTLIVADISGVYAFVAGK